MERYWVPSAPESALFGTRIADRFFEVTSGGDLAFLVGALKALIEQRLGRERLRRRTHRRFRGALAPVAASASWADARGGGGLPRARDGGFARDAAERRAAVLVWRMGATQHVFGEDNVRAIVNLALARASSAARNAG